MKRIALLICIAMISMTAFAQPAAKSVALTFIETSDVHGAIYPYDFVSAKPTATSLAQAVSLIAEERAANPNTILVDDGDSLQGTPMVYYYNFEKTDVAHVWAQAVNYLKYDFVGVGNHDIEAGHAVYDKLYQDIKAPVLCANAVKPDGTPYFKPYSVIVKDGVKIAVLGMITPKIPDWLPPQFWTGMEFEDMVDCAKKWVPIIQAKEKPDVLIGLFHAGVDYTYGNVTADTKFNENAAQLVAQKVPGFDIIFAGHDHSGWDGMGWDPANKKKVDIKDPNGKTVYIYGALNAARKVPVVNMSLDWNADTNAWDKRVRGALVDISKYATDPEFTAQFDEASAAVKAWVDRPIGKMDGKITTRESMFGDSAFVDLIHRIQLDLSKDPAIGLAPADISFAAPLSADAYIPTSTDGTLYVRDMFNLYVYENFLYTMTMTGKQVKDFLEYSYRFWFDTMAKEGDHLIAFQKKDGQLVLDNRTNMPLTQTRYYNYDSAAGINYFVDVSQPAGQRVEITSMSDGRIFNPDETYTVAINSYRGSNGGGHLVQGAGLDPTVVRTMKLVNGATTKDLRYFLLKWFEAQEDTVTVSPIGNWMVVPENLAASGAALDYPLLYPPKK
ncbi:MAG: bifunctional UDP-sugar hydrolase/5'-nucleotidase [Spirochaetes bacterium]|nr:bifunctional UDP-sugar hydrolase/5'-nucleotidase [Spirochaetota bacterium]